MLGMALWNLQLYYMRIQPKPKQAIAWQIFLHLKNAFLPSHAAFMQGMNLNLTANQA
jgi:hypothetical protein